MSEKRLETDGTDPTPAAKKMRHEQKCGVHEVMMRESWKPLLEEVLEPLIRRVIKEELDLALQTHLPSTPWNSRKENDSFQTRNLNLKFSSKICLPVFTGAKIEGVDTLKIILVDSVSGEVVDSGPESYARVEIVVLEGAFDGNESGNWAIEDFESNIVKHREGKTLLMGESILFLKAGYGLVGEILFTDNSSWTRSRKFRLGARVLDSSHSTRIKEAKTEAFVVRDHRGTLYKKHYPPVVGDEVWRLHGIGKDGAFDKRLARENIRTVKEFLLHFFTDPLGLRNILGNGMSNKMWEVITEHARTCVPGKERFLYYPCAPQTQHGVAFNEVGQVFGLFLDSHYVPLDKLSETDKANARNSVVAALDHWNEVVSFKDEASLLSEVLPFADVLPLEFGLPQLGNNDLFPEIGGIAYGYTLPRPRADSVAAEFSYCEEVFLPDTNERADLQDSGNSCRSSAHACVKSAAARLAQRRWKRVSSVLKVFTLWRLVARPRPLLRQDEDFLLFLDET